MPATALRSFPFSALGEEALGALLRFGIRRSVAKNSFLVRQGETGETLYVIERGKAKVVRSGADGKEVILSLLGPGDVIGEMALIDDEPRSAGVVTMEDSDVHVISRQEFAACLSRHPEIALALLAGMSRRLRAADRKISDLATLDVYGRVARTLLELACPLNGRKVVVGRITQKDIAGMVGASREMVSRIFRDLEESGYIRMEPAGIVVNETAGPAG